MPPSNLFNPPNAMELKNLSSDLANINNTTAMAIKRKMYAKGSAVVGENAKTRIKNPDKEGANTFAP